MKKQVRAVFLAAALMAAASTQAATYNGDLLIGFTSQSGNDYIYDLGQASALFSGETFNLSGALAGFNLNTVHWGVIGDKNVLGTRTAWTTSGGIPPIPVASTAAWGTLDTATKSIYQNFPLGGAGDSVSIAASDDNSWNQQTIVGSLTTQYHNVYQYGRDRFREFLQPHCQRLSANVGWHFFAERKRGRHIRRSAGAVILCVRGDGHAGTFILEAAITKDALKSNLTT